MAEATILTHYLCAKADKVFLEDRFRFFLVLLVAAPVDEPAFCFRFFLVLLAAVPVDKLGFCFRLRGFVVILHGIHFHAAFFS